MGGKTSYKSIKKYTDKTYDRIAVLVPKGQKSVISSYAETHHMSVNALIKRAITTETGIDLDRNH